MSEATTKTRKRLGWVTLADVHAVLRREIKMAELARQRGVSHSEVIRSVRMVDPAWRFNAVPAETIQAIVQGLLTVEDVAKAYRLHTVTVRKMVNAAAPELARKRIVRNGKPAVPAQQQPEALAA